MSNEVKWLGNMSTKELGDTYERIQRMDRLDRMNKVKELRRKQKQEKMLHRYLEV